MKLFRTLISLEEALRTLSSYAKGTEIEEIRFEAALNRVLAEDVVSLIDSPPFDRAAMDGYAIRGEDSFGAAPRNPVFLKINRRVEEEIGAGECVPIATGMPVPKGSNAVVMLEYTKELGDTLEIFKPVTPGKNVSFKGEDVKKGEAVLKAGKLLQAHDIGMLASLFKITVKVYKRAKIGIISTGDELIDPTLQQPEQEQRHQKIADANSYVLAALTQKVAVPYRMGIVRDNYDGIKNALRSALEGDCEGLLVSGGSSVGKRDFLADAVEELGEIVFHGVAIRPGEPTGFGIVNNKPVFVLPGYPVATISAFELLVRPFLYAMHGVTEERSKIFAVASKKISSAVGRTDFVRVKVIRTGEGHYVEPLRVSGSGILSSMTKSDGFVVIAENKEGVAEGERVAVTEYFAL
ncbi:MAG: molybdopterin molybdotransferase MoeA [Methanosarcinales archaeon]|nr:molybdopterin molybdotransferase MoeA [Methanosarcinales archaeon]